MIRVGICYAALRSGSTMFRLMLNGNPALACLGENDFLFDHLTQDAAGSWRYDREGLVADRIFQASGLKLPADLRGRSALADMIAQIAEKGGGIPILMLHRHFDRVVALLPEAPVIRLKRDPRDVARSNMGMGWAGNTYHGVGRWLRTEADWERGLPDAKAPIFELRYEDLLANPAQHLGEICTFLGIAYDPAMMTVDERSTYDRPDARYAYQWRSKQTPKEIGLVEGRLGQRLQEYGYDPSGHPILKPNLVHRLSLWLQNKAAVWRHLAGQYGLATALQRGLARRMGLRALERRAQARIDLITNRHLK